MPIVSLKAHFDGKSIQLDEPYPLFQGAQLIVTVLEDEREEWNELGVRGLRRAYGDNEPDYSAADLLQP